MSLVEDQTTVEFLQKPKKSAFEAYSTIPISLHLNLRHGRLRLRLESPTIQQSNNLLNPHLPPTHKFHRDFFPIRHSLIRNQERIY